MSLCKVVFGSLLCAAIVSVSTAVPAAAQAKPDLRVLELTVDQVQTTNVPLRLKATIQIKNFGATTPSDFTTRLYYKTKSSDPYTALQDFHSGVRQPNGGDRWDKTFDFQEGGTYYFKAEADADKKIPESLEGNNIKTLTRNFAAGTPDLTIANVAAKFVSVSSSSAHARVDWDVENTGDGKAAGLFVTVVKVSKNGAGFVELARFSKSDLAKGGSLHYFKDVTYADARSLRFMIVVDETHVIHERNENNNTAYSDTIKP
jgi:subtilase family serine protease